MAAGDPCSSHTPLRPHITATLMGVQQIWQADAAWLTRKGEGAGRRTSTRCQQGPSRRWGEAWADLQEVDELDGVGAVGEVKVHTLHAKERKK